MNLKDLQKKAAQIRVDVLEAIHKAGSGYTGSSMSVVEILISLYYGDLGGKPIVKVDERKPDWDSQDYVILSKGQAAIVQYAILADLGFFLKSELGFYRQRNSMLQSRPSIKVPGIRVSVPAHGYGLPMAMGLAMSLKMDRKPNKVFTILGDAELQEGITWEAANSSAFYKLDNLITFIDNDEFQADGPIKAVMDLGNIQSKFEAFGWKVIKVTDGHNFDQILDAIVKAFTVNRQPVCILCKTIKGKGIPFAEKKLGYHAAALSDAELAEIIPKLKAIYE